MNKDILYPLRCLHGKIYEWHQARKRVAAFRNEFVPMIRKRMLQEPETVFLVLTPEHGNLGDHAIAASEVVLMEQLGRMYIEITSNQLEQLRKEQLLDIMNGHPIFINGGGNMGTLWPAVEQLHRDIIVSNPKSAIFILPNTIYYEDTPWGREQLKESIRIYNGHDNLFLYAREEISYRFMDTYYRNVMLVPDMVLFLDESAEQKQRKGCLLCLRSDCERTRTQEQEQQLVAQARSLFGENVAYTDMNTVYKFLPDNRNTELYRKFEEFKSAELVITDRLHGMIFCAITGTPCIVIDSKSPKVKGCFQWIRNLGYVHFAQDVSQIETIYRGVAKGNNRYDNRHLQRYYRELAQDIKEKLRRIGDY